MVAVYEDRHEVAVVDAGGRLMRKSIPFKRTKVLACVSQADPEDPADLVAQGLRTWQQTRLASTLCIQAQGAQDS